MGISKHIGLKRHRNRRSAFSLVEVTLAIGIVGIGFIPMMGLLPTGLNVFRQSMGAFVGAQIAQRVIAEAQQTDFATLSGSASKINASTRYFDTEGTEIDDSASTRWIYAVKTQVKSPAEITRDGIAGLQCSGLMSIVVQVVCDPARKPLSTNADGYVDGSQELSVQTFSSLVSANK